MKHDTISDTQLNAFIDHQLDDAERVEILAAVQQDSQLSQELAELSQLKEWVQLTYRQPPQPQARPQIESIAASRAFQSIAALLLLGIGLFSGWWAHTPVPGPSFHELTQLDGTQIKNQKVLLHISKMDARRISSALDKAEEILLDSKTKNRPLQLEIVANASGLGLLREGSPFGHRVKTLSQQYNNVSFLACGIAMENVRLKEGKEPQLLPEAQKINAALEQILGRLKDGWSYIKG